MNGRIWCSILAACAPLLLAVNSDGSALAQTAAERFQSPATDRLQPREAEEALPSPSAPLREGYSIDDGRFARGELNEHGAFIVAGCVPQNHFSRAFPVGSSWSLCNDLDFVKDKVEETPLTSCLDIYEHGVLEGFFIKEVSNLVTTEAIMSAETSSAVTPIEQRHYSAPAIATFSEITERPLFSAGREPVEPAIAARVVTRGNF